MSVDGRRDASVVKWSETYLYTSREAPADADIISQKLLSRAGFIKKLAPGIFTYGPFLLRALGKFEQIIREELTKRGGIEILMPMVQPRAIWEESSRWEGMGAGLLKFQNRNEHWFCLGATHEEAVCDYVRSDIRSYRDLPKTLFQIQTKYRDEIRPRFGLLRGREFIMKDAYTFDVSREAAIKNYDLMYEAYRAIFDRSGLNYRIVEADAGNIGGSQTHEFQLLTDAGEDALLVSTDGDFAANVEVCPALNTAIVAGNILSHGESEKFATPGLRTIEALAKSLNSPASSLVKTLFFTPAEARAEDRTKMAFAILTRGDHEANPIKIKNFLGFGNPPEMLDAREVKEVTGGADPGSCGPVGLKLPVYVDLALQGMQNFIVGANENDFHLKNVNFERDFKVQKFGDLRIAREGDPSPTGRGTLKAYRGIEVGHIFYLGTKYSEKMGVKFQSEAGDNKFVEMGCYGIGVSRTIQASIEQNYDKDGIIWPRALSPFSVHICVLDQDLIVEAVKIAETLSSRGHEVFIDDRNERPGVKFKDADLIGYPIRINLGKKFFSLGQCEVVDRKTKTATVVELAGLAAHEAFTC